MKLSGLIGEERAAEILRRLAGIEAAEGVRILYACESGSRAWGFPSADSDYDIRFLYVHDVRWYLSVTAKRDVIERPLVDLMDESGWELRKALNLLRKSNPPLLEWMQSPIVYREAPGFADEFRELMRTWYSPKAAMFHYLHMARGNMREYLKGERVWVKKYFYILRPVLACLWVEKGLGVVPIEFRLLVDGTVPPGPLRDAIERLLIDKAAGREQDEGPRIPVFHELFEREVPRLEAIAADASRAGPREEAGLDGFFQRWIGLP